MSGSGERTGHGHRSASAWAGVRGSLAAVLLAAGLLVPAPPVAAFIPYPDRTLQAIAAVNRASGRSEALRLEVSMRFGERPPVARGELIIHPSGLARLELRGVNGRVDRYLLSGRELLGTTNGQPLARPGPLLQPLFFLQPSSGVTLRSALHSFDVLSDAIGLATCGEQDCFVIGDPRLAAPLPGAEAEAEQDAGVGPADALGDPLAEPVEGLDADAVDPGAMEADPSFASDLGLAPAEQLAGPELVIAEDALLPRLWVDTQDLQVRRIDRANGVFTIFGPIVAFEKLQLPAWFEIHEPGAESPIRFEVDRAVQVNAPATAFSRKWLMAPIESPSAGAPPAGAAGGTPGEGLDPNPGRPPRQNP